MSPKSSTLDGAELEDQGGLGSSSSHWEKRVFNDEYMTATSHYWPLKTNLTLALLATTGWYRVNYSVAEPQSFGRHLGWCVCVCRSFLSNLSIVLTTSSLLSSRQSPFVAPRCDAWTGAYRCRHAERGAWGCSWDRTEVRLLASGSQKQLKFVVAFVSSITSEHVVRWSTTASRWRRSTSTTSRTRARVARSLPTIAPFTTLRVILVVGVLLVCVFIFIFLLTLSFHFALETKSSQRRLSAIVVPGGESRRLRRALRRLVALPRQHAAATSRQRR